MIKATRQSIMTDDCPVGLCRLRVHIFVARLAVMMIGLIVFSACWGIRGARANDSAVPNVRRGGQISREWTFSELVKTGIVEAAKDQVPGLEPLAQESQVIQFERYHSNGFRSHCNGVDYQSDVLPWLVQCQQRIRAAGFDEKGFTGYRVTIRIDIDAMKSTGKLSIADSSGSNQIDQAALALIQNSSPLQQPEIGLPFNRSLILVCDYPKLELKFLPDKDPPPWSVDPYTMPRPIKKGPQYTSYP